MGGRGHFLSSLFIWKWCWWREQHRHTPFFGFLVHLMLESRVWLVGLFKCSGIIIFCPGLRDLEYCLHQWWEKYSLHITFTHSHSVLCTHTPGQWLIFSLSQAQCPPNQNWKWSLLVSCSFISVLQPVIGSGSKYLAPRLSKWPSHCLY